MEVLGLSTPQTILVIEDKLSFAYRLVDYLERHGHIVYAFAGVKSVQGKMLTGIHPLEESTPEDIDLSKIQVCFLDHYFEGDAFTGSTIMLALAPLGIKVCGMSSVDPANKSMLRYGAVCAYRKDVLARMLGL